MKLRRAEKANGLFLQFLSVCSDELGCYSYARSLEWQDQNNWLVQDSIRRPRFLWNTNRSSMEV